MGTTFVAKTVSQKIPWNVIVNERYTDSHPRTIYTCPTGKKAVGIVTAQCTGLGSATLARIRVDNGSDFITLGEWRNVVPSTFSVSPPNANRTNFNYFTLGTDMIKEISLTEGQEILTFQDSGTNAEFNIFLQVQETPA